MAKTKEATGNVINSQPAMETVEVPAAFWGLLPAYSAPVAGVGLAWDFPMCCSMCNYDAACADPGLCLYVTCCPTCMLSEMSYALGAKGCCGTEGCGAQFCSAFWCEQALNVLGQAAGCQGALGPLVYTAWGARTRDVMQARYGLPKDEICCDSTVYTYAPSYCIFSCAPCALYQQAYFLKHTAKHDFECCCYTGLCQKPLEDVSEA